MGLGGIVFGVGGQPGRPVNVLRRSLWVTYSSHYVTVIPVWFLILTTVGSIPRHTILVREVGRDGTRTGFGVRPGRGRR
jgi:hypothetical protein